MAKQTMTSRPPVGTKVVFNHLHDATIFEVTKHDDHPCLLWVREYGKPTYTEQLVDYSQCMVPSKLQLTHAGVV